MRVFFVAQLLSSERLSASVVYSGRDRSSASGQLQGLPDAMLTFLLKELGIFQSQRRLR